MWGAGSNCEGSGSNFPKINVFNIGLKPLLPTIAQIIS